MNKFDRQRKMTRDEFAEICGELLIPIEIALENENVHAALRERASAEEVKRILTEEF